ncbi:MAG TPA: 2Fe-2S iron-sulfur cluster-binding protein, partial [Porticoccaceae bacterium]
MIEVEVFRYNPEADSAPSTQTVQVPEHFRKAMVLDVLEYLRERDATLAYRRSCREGVCGSDGMNINGVNRLACVTPVGDMLSAGRLIVRPLTGMPVIRDLVVDQTLFFAQYARVQPYLINDGPVPATERRQSPA